MDKSVTYKLFDQMGDRFLDRQGGYIRILKTGYRTGDGASLVIIQLLLAHEGKSSGKKTKRGVKGERKIPEKVPDEETNSKGKMQVSEGEQ